MTSSLRLAAPAAGTLKNAAVLIVIVLIPGVMASAVAGMTASIAVGLCAGAAMSFGTLMPPRRAALTTLALGAAAAAGAAAAGNAWWSATAVALVVLLTAPANIYSAGMLTMAPILTLVFALTDQGWPWWKAGLWGVIGGLVGLAIAGAMKFGQRPQQPLDPRLAWRHAAVVAVVAFLSIVVEESLLLDHGYWLTVTLLVVLRPVPGERREYVVQRLYGTIGGGVLALLTVLLLPSGLLMVAAFGFLVVLAAYAMSGNYFMQTLFLTPMLLLFISSDSSSATTVDLTVRRVLFTIAGVVVAVGIVWLMELWDERSGLVRADDPAGEPAASEGS